MLTPTGVGSSDLSVDPLPRCFPRRCSRLCGLQGGHSPSLSKAWAQRHLEVALSSLSCSLPLLSGSHCGLSLLGSVGPGPSPASPAGPSASLGMCAQSRGLRNLTTSLAVGVKGRGPP